RLPDLHQLVDETLVRLQCAQELSELPTSAAELVGGALGLFLEPAPLVDQELLLLRLEAGVGLERAQLVAGMGERLVAELRNGAVVRHRTERRADDRSQVLDLAARFLDIGPAVDLSGAVFDLLIELGDSLLEGVELLREFL